MSLVQQKDKVTGSYCESWLAKRYDEVVAGGSGDYALISLRLKHFSQINRAYGRQSGDAVLRTAYRQICSCLRANEYAVRVYAGYFNILLRLGSIDETHERTIGIIKAVRDNTALSTLKGQVFCGAGVYPIASEAESVSFYVAQYNADLCRKNSGQADYRNSHYEIYGYSYHNPNELFVDLQKKVLPAIQAGDFKLYLQPKVDIRTGAVSRAELLMRWVDPDKGLIPLAKFLPGLEQSGDIRKVDIYLFEQLCKQLRRWLDVYGKQLYISVNLSKAYFEDPDVLEEYMAVINRYSVPPECIEIEFIESIIMDDTTLMKKLAGELSKQGVRCGIDDFGSGYSSFNVLTNVELDELKIDRSLFADSSNTREHAVIMHILALAKALGIVTVAEGVETMDYVRILQGWGCDYVQGYVFYRPMPIEEFEQRFVQGDERVEL